MDSFTFTLDKATIETIGEALDTAPMARRRTSPAIASVQQQIVAQQQAAQAAAAKAQQDAAAALGPAPQEDPKPARKPRGT